MSAVRFHQATLPYPKSAAINRALQVNRHAHRPVFPNPLAVAWKRDAILSLRQAGVYPLPRGDWTLMVGYRLYSLQMDVDAPSKAVLDVVAAALEVDDRRVVATYHVKVRPARRTDERVEVVIWAAPSDETLEASHLAEAMWRYFNGAFPDETVLSA